MSRLRVLAARAKHPRSLWRAAVVVAVDRVLVPVAGGPPPGLRRGRGRSRDGGTVVLVVQVDGSPAATSRLLALLAAAAPDGVTPVLVLPPPAWPLARQAGYVVEQLPADPPARASRLLELRRTYATDAVVVLSGAADTGAALLHALVVPRRPPGAWAAGRRRLRELERRLDPGPG